MSRDEHVSTGTSGGQRCQIPWGLGRWVSGWEHLLLLQRNSLGPNTHVRQCTSACIFYQCLLYLSFPLTCPVSFFSPDPSSLLTLLSTLPCIPSTSFSVALALFASEWPGISPSWLASPQPCGAKARLAAKGQGILPFRKRRGNLYSSCSRLIVWVVLPWYKFDGYRFYLFVFNPLRVLECGPCRRKWWRSMTIEKAVGEGERPGRRIMDGSKVVPRGGESMESRSSVDGVKHER